ncbi:MAG: hypothetical protein ABIR68_02240, partial [Ilumatobacteraceae bacterium]
MRRSRIAAVLAVATLLAACSSDKKSIIDSGNQATTTANAAATTVPTTTSVPGSTTTVAGTPGTGTGATGATATTGAPTTSAAPTTTTAPVDLSQFPACPTDALAAATSPVKIKVWNAMTGDLLTEFDKLVSDYNASQTKVQVESIAQGGYEDVIDKYLQSDQGSLPDIAQMPEYMVQNIVDTKTAVPVAACIAADK